MKANNAENVELLTIRLSKDKTPIAFENKVQELMEECGYSREDAESTLSNMEFEMEIFYEKGKGLFILESDAVESNCTYSPYSKEEIYCED